MTTTQEQADGLSESTARLREEMSGLNRLADSFGQTLVRSFASAIIHGRKLSDVLRGIALSLAQQALSQALRPLGNLLGSVFANARGNLISAGRIKPFAQGGVINSPVMFPLRGGLGLAGEAGPEAIMPLARGRDGKLGVRMAGSGQGITINIMARDAESFRQSQSQIAAGIARAVSRGQRNL
ncbi:MAG: phage tail tape measure protein [Aestuariivirga sp.]